MHIYLKDNTIDLIGRNVHAIGLTFTQAQNLLLALDFEKDCLFEALCAFDEHGWNSAELGITGSFIFGTYQGINQ